MATIDTALELVIKEQLALTQEFKHEVSELQDAGNKFFQSVDEIFASVDKELKDMDDSTTTTTTGAKKRTASDSNNNAAPPPAKRQKPVPEEEEKKEEEEDDEDEDEEEEEEEDDDEQMEKYNKVRAHVVQVRAARCIKCHDTLGFYRPATDMTQIREILCEGCLNPACLYPSYDAENIAASDPYSAQYGYNEALDGAYDKPPVAAAVVAEKEEEETKQE